jgi:putative transcriptional regulator
VARHEAGEQNQGAMNHSEHVEERLPEFVLGQLPASDRVEVQRHLEACMACRAAASELEEAVGLASSALGPPSAGLRRLETSLAGVLRFEHLVPRLARLYDLGEEEARQLLARVDDEASWMEGPGEGIQLMEVQAGPACEGRINALLRLVPGATFPDHEHGDEERVLVLEGGFLDSEGFERWRGELDVRAKGTRHTFTALEGLPCLCASTTVFPGEA